MLESHRDHSKSTNNKNYRNSNDEIERHGRKQSYFEM